jgi:hypothetical protein
MRRVHLEFAFFNVFYCNVYIVVPFFFRVKITFGLKIFGLLLFLISESFPSNMINVIST